MNIPLINLVLLKRINTLEPSVFDDTAHSVEYLLKLAGFRTHLSCNVIDPNALNIIWGAHAHFSPPLEHILEVAKPEFSVIFNMEQIAIGNSFVTHDYLSFLSKYRVLDYNFRNIQKMQEFIPALIGKEFPVIPSCWMASDFTISESSPSSDVVFWGANSGRRQETLNSIIKNGNSARVINSAYGEYLSQEIFESQICLNIHALQTGIFEIARCLRPLAMGMPIVSELSHLPNLVDWGQSGIFFCEYDDIPNLCKKLINNPKLLIDSNRKTQHFINRKYWSELAREVIIDLLKM
jgi:hypothetical protein